MSGFIETHAIDIYTCIYACIIYKWMSYKTHSEHLLFVTSVEKTRASPFFCLQTGYSVWIESFLNLLFRPILFTIIHICRSFVFCFFLFRLRSFIFMNRSEAFWHCLPLIAGALNLLILCVPKLQSRPHLEM